MKNRTLIVVLIALVVVAAVLASFGLSLFPGQIPRVELPTPGTGSPQQTVSPTGPGGDEFLAVEVTPDTVQEVIATLDITGEVLDLSAAGAYVGVLYSDSLVLYDRQLQPLHRLEGTDYAGHLLVSADGSALVIAGNTAWRYLP